MSPTNNYTIDQISQLVGVATKIVVVQADNPDADSLGSALALEQIIGDMDKHVNLYCGVDIPGYLKYLTGWSRVSTELPRHFDLSIIVDTSTTTLLEKLQTSGELKWLAARPSIVLDHHQETQNDISFATQVINDPSVSSTGELIYHLAAQLQWPVNTEAMSNLMTAILGDTQGLTNQLARARTYRVMASMIEAGVDRTVLEEARREYSKMPLSIFKYKARLIERTELTGDGQIALVTIPQSELNEYSPLYNPGPLIQPDMLQTEGVTVSIVLKHYDDGKITGAIRCNHGYGIAAQLADHFGGGGHEYAAGFKLLDNKPVEEVKTECLNLASDLLNNLNQETSHEAV